VTRLFASDLHLDPSRPEVTAQFLAFVAGPAREAQALYLLGDLFEAWLGDDAPDALGEALVEALAGLAGSGVALFVMQGNRDFLLGERFCKRAGACFLPDPSVITIGSRRVLLTHGDALCTGDASYQRLRALVRDPGVQRAFLALPLERRRALATVARAGSRAHLATADEYITDVSQEAVARTLATAGVDILLHGHTHRPAVHRFRVGQRDCTRIVLGDWHRQGSVLRWDEDGYRLLELARASGES
jgi:UDP-2,3-diacylglucosamine hydrolase